MERGIMLIAFIMCAVPFLIISHYNKDSQEPITFWSGDRTLKEKVKDVSGYNHEMARLYGKVAAVLMGTGIIGAIIPIAAIVCMGVELTVGIYVVYRKYKKILNCHGKETKSGIVSKGTGKR